MRGRHCVLAAFEAFRAVQYTIANLNLKGLSFFIHTVVRSIVNFQLCMWGGGGVNGRPIFFAIKLI